MKTMKTTKKEDENKKTRRRKGLVEFVLNCADEYRQNIPEDWRDSLSFRNAEGKCQRDFQAEVNADECHRVHKSYELKWAGERDAEEYRKKVAKEWRHNPDALIAKDKENLTAAEKLAKKEQSHAKIEKRLKESDALSTLANRIAIT